MALTALKNIDLSYTPESPRILNNFSLEIQAGEFVSLLGPSGSGKTTIMNLIAGFLTPSSGSVEFQGSPLAGVNRNVGYMTQGDTLLPWRTVESNVALPLEIRKVAKSEIDDRVATILAVLGLADATQQYPSELSGGMKRRALLARSLIYEPSMLLMDEPFGALDAQLRERLHQEFLDTVHRLGQTVLFITHDLFESITLSDRVVVVGGRPLTSIAELEMPFGRNRDLAAVRQSTEYAQLTTEVRAHLTDAQNAEIEDA